MNLNVKMHLIYNSLVSLKPTTFNMEKFTFALILVILGPVSSRHIQIERNSLLGSSIKYFDQEIDHNGRINGTFKQLYYEANSDDPDSENNLKFLFVGGQNALSMGSVDINFMSQLADKFLADKYALEHRFYGSSQPTNDLSTESLKLLTIEQALEDINSFINYINNQDRTVVNKWILFGYDYAGNLAIWSRLTNPDLVFGAVASGAPVQTELIFKDFAVQVSNLISQSAPKCTATIKNGMAQLVKNFNSPQKRQNLKDLFKSCAIPQDQFDKFSLTSYIFNVFSNGAVYNLQQGNKNTLDSYCETLLNKKGDDLTKLASFVSQFYSPDTQCFDYSYVGKNILNSHEISSYDFSRQIYYQKCTQLGMFETTSENDQPFAHALPLMYYTKLCKDAFGEKFTQQTIEQGIKATNDKYKGNKLDGVEYLLVVNGGKDPWRLLGIQAFNDVKYSKVLTNKDGWHCQDQQIGTEQDSKELKSLRNEISDSIEKWIP